MDETEKAEEVEEDSPYKMRILDMAENMSDEEFNKVVSRFNIIDTSIGKILSQLNPLLIIFGFQAEKPLASAPSLCESCSKPCSRASATTSECDDYSEKTDDCHTCAYFDIDTCKHPDTCLGNSLYDPIEDRYIDV